MWNRARNYAELCECAARFVEGRLQHFPGWGAKLLDEESALLEPVLARLCRAGWLTTASQPGRERDPAGYEQRAFVAGFVAAPLLRRLPELEALGLRVVRQRAVALARDARGARVLGQPGSQVSELELFAAELQAPAWRALAQRQHCTLYDPRFGRGPLLWNALEAWLSGQIAPSRRPRRAGHRAQNSPSQSRRPRRRKPN